MAKERRMFRAILLGYLIEVGLAVLLYVGALTYHATQYKGYCGGFDPDFTISKAPPPPCSFGGYMREAVAGYFTIGSYALTVGFLLVLPLSLLVAVGLYAIADSLYLTLKKKGAASRALS